MFNKLVGYGDLKIVLEDRSHRLFLDMVKGESRYSVKDSIWTDILKICLELNQKDLDVSKLVAYVESDRVLNDINEFQCFFLFESGEVAKVRVCLSDTPSHPLPPTLLVVDDDDFSANDADYRVARVGATDQEFYIKTSFGWLHAEESYRLGN